MKKYLILCCLPFTLLYGGIQDESGLKIATPSLVNRKTCKIRLENGLEAMLFSDPETPCSGAALAVGVGSSYDPVDRPGMAHYVEHMLFLGTEKYPDESGYTRYLDEHGGSRNAFTMDDRTVYMFSVNNDGFDEALDRFGHFFVAPLFDPSGLQRECKAIHQEYCKNVPIDAWRHLHVRKELANKNHPFHAFTIGNKDTLSDVARDEIKEWYDTHYSANIMRLVVYSSKPIDVLETEVRELFAHVKNLNFARTASRESLLTEENFGKLVHAAPLQEHRKLELTWELPTFFAKDKEIHAEKLISHILGHEGEESLLAELKRKYLASELGVECYPASYQQSLFTISITLTDKGVENYEEVIGDVFARLASLKKSGVPRYIYDEIRTIEEMNYSYQSREEIFDFVTKQAFALLDEPIETFPRKTLMPTSFSPDKIQELLAAFTPSNCQYFLIAPVENPENQEKWLFCDYSVKPLSKIKLAKWENLPAQVAKLPSANPYLPTDLNLLSDLPEIEKPTYIAETPNSIVYYAPDKQFLVPEVYWNFTFENEAIKCNDTKSAALSDLYALALLEELNATTYEASIAKLFFTIKPLPSGLSLTVRGFHDKAENLLAKIVAKMGDLKISEEQFALTKKRLAQAYGTQLNSSPINIAKELVQQILYEEYACIPAKQEELALISYANFNHFCSKDLWKKSYCTAMLYGNLDEGQAKRIGGLIEQNLVVDPYEKSKHSKKKLASFSDKPSFLVKKCELPSGALILTIDNGEFSFKRRAAQEILSKGLEEPFFSELRTKQQTAYFVTNWARDIDRHLYSFFAIQSSSHDPRDLLARFELFLEVSLEKLDSEVIPEERFAQLKRAYIEKLSNPVISLEQKGELLQTLAVDYDGDFDWLEKRVQGFEELSYAEFLSFAQEFIGKKNAKRVAVLINSAPASKDFYSEQPNLQTVRSKISYLET